MDSGAEHRTRKGTGKVYQVVVRDEIGKQFALAFEGMEVETRRPALVGAAFNMFLIPLLGIIFLPFATLIYVILYTPGIGLTGWEWFWVILAGLFDIGHWGASYTQRNQIPGARGA